MKNMREKNSYSFKVMLVVCLNYIYIFGEFIAKISNQVERL